MYSLSNPWKAPGSKIALLQKYLKVLGSPYLVLQFMTLTCGVIIVNNLRPTKGRFLLEKGFSRLQFNGA